MSNLPIQGGSFQGPDGLNYPIQRNEGGHPLPMQYQVPKPLVPMPQPVQPKWTIWDSMTRSSDYGSGRP